MVWRLLVTRDAITPRSFMIPFGSYLFLVSLTYFFFLFGWYFEFTLIQVFILLFYFFYTFVSALSRISDYDPPLSCIDWWKEFLTEISIVLMVVLPLSIPFLIIHWPLN